MNNRRLDKKKVFLYYSDYGIGMKWYNYLIVAMILGAIMSFSQSFTYFSNYDSVSYPADLVACDKTYYILAIGISLLQLYVWNELRLRTQKAPDLVVKLHAISTLPTVISYIEASLITDYYYFLSTAIISLFMGAIYAFITYKYFSKRKFIFVNWCVIKPPISIAYRGLIIVYYLISHYKLYTII